jgi:hypothetical protein
MSLKLILRPLAVEVKEFLGSAVRGLPFALSTRITPVGLIVLKPTPTGD